MEIDFSKLKITQVKEDVNLMLFNSKQFTTNDMVLFNQLMEAVKDVKITLPNY